MAPFLISGKESIVIPFHPFQECKSEIGPQKASYASIEHFCQTGIPGTFFLGLKYFDFKLLVGRQTLESIVKMVNCDLDENEKFYFLAIVYL